MASPQQPRGQNFEFLNIAPFVTEYRMPTPNSGKNSIDREILLVTKKMAAATSAALIALSLASSANAALSFDVTFNDPGNAYSSYYSSIQNNIVAAGNQWASYFNTSSINTTLTVNIGFDSIPTANGGSATTSFYNTQGGIFTYEQGAAYELRTGVDPNGAAADINFNIGINGYLQSELWFDPTPNNLLDDIVPINQTDARSVFLHEFGHALGFNGWRNGSTGLLPGNYQSTFDAFTTLINTPQGDTLFFTGAQAQAVYGGLVPLSFGNYGHVANGDGRPGSNLISDLMNGITFFRGTRYEVSALDLAILSDIGLPVNNGPAAVPEPSSYALMFGGLGLMAWVNRRRRSR